MKKFSEIEKEVDRLCTYRPSHYDRSARLAYSQVDFRLTDEEFDAMQQRLRRSRDALGNCFKYSVIAFIVLVCYNQSVELQFSLLGITPSTLDSIVPLVAASCGLINFGYALFKSRHEILKSLMTVCVMRTFPPSKWRLMLLLTGITGRIGDENDIWNTWLTNQHVIHNLAIITRALSSIIGVIISILFILYINVGILFIVIERSYSTWVEWSFILFIVSSFFFYTASEILSLRLGKEKDLQLKIHLITQATELSKRGVELDLSVLPSQLPVEYVESEPHKFL